MPSWRRGQRPSEHDAGYMRAVVPLAAISKHCPCKAGGVHICDTVLVSVLTIQAHRLEWVIQMTFALRIVGCGACAQPSAQGIQSLRHDIDLLFASRDVQRARAYAALFQGSGAFGAYDAAAADPRVEAMYLCTPHHLHQAHAALAARAGKHILVEKPIARTLEEGRGIIAEAQRAGVTLMVAENYHFMAAVRACKGLIAQGRIGRLRLVQMQEEAPFRPDQWRRRHWSGRNGASSCICTNRRRPIRPCAMSPLHARTAAIK